MQLLLTESGIINLFNAEHFINALSPMDLTPSGIITSFSETHSEIALFPILCKP